MAALLILVWEGSRGDLWVARAVGSADGFHWRGQVLFRDILHDGGRWLSAVTLGAWALWAAGIGEASDGPRRGERWRAWGLTVALLLLVPAVKRLSLASCPWDLALFGGTARYLSHWVLWWPGAGDGGPGHCFPAGHATSAFAFLPGVWLWWQHDRRKAMAWGAAVLAAGVLVSLAQTVRGAHFVSHNLWTAWICWAGCASVAPRWLMVSRRAPRLEPQWRHARPIPQTTDRT
ncbi:phosphatase PAP2 family protein [Caldimonas sp.]|uniref:phosphatase PAP2 family protein n=1 Tax=Caldimonas sp. TaxID=2838790 RepID=UPI00391B404E